jgi:hypothetical protein
MNASRHIFFDGYSKLLLTAIAVLLGIVAFRPLARPTPVQAQSGDFHYYLEPGVVTVRRPDGTQQVEGKMVVDLRNGDVWGFPTLLGSPYPVDPTRSQPPTSTPIYLGRFDFSKMTDAARERAMGH